MESVKSDTPIVVRPSHSHTCPEIVWLTLQIIRPFSLETFKHREDHGMAVRPNKVAAGPSQFLRFFFSSEGREGLFLGKTRPCLCRVEPHSNSCWEASFVPSRSTLELGVQINFM